MHSGRLVSLSRSARARWLWLGVACAGIAAACSPASNEPAPGPEGIGALGNEAGQGGTMAGIGGSTAVGGVTGTGGAGLGGGAGTIATGAGGTAGTGVAGSGTGGSDVGTGGVGGSVAGTGGSGTSGAGGSGTPGTFDRPTGEIPNFPQPPSTVDLPQDQWQSGLISPTLLQGHQINQPAVIDGYLVVGGNEEFWIYDVSDPTDPLLLSHFETPGSTGGEAESHTLSFARYGNTLYMATVSGYGIDIWNITDATAVEHVSSARIEGTNYGDYTNAVWGVAWQGQYIYVGATNNGIFVVNVADPASPEVLTSKKVSTSAYGGVSAGPVEAIGNVLVVMTPKESGGIATLDISDPESPIGLDSVTAPISYIGQFYRRYAFLIGPLRAWDVLSDPRNISSQLDSVNHGGAEYLSFSDDRLFLGHVRSEIGGTPGVSKFDIANPSNIQLESRIWGRLNLGNVNDDQFTVPFGNLLAIGDDQAPYAGLVIAVHQADPDTTPPAVDTVIPNDGSSVSVKSRIGISLTDNIDLKTVNAASFIVRPVGGDPLPGIYGNRMGVLNFDPDSDLQPGTDYEVILPAGGITDTSGNPIASEFKSTFRTN